MAAQLTSETFSSALNFFELPQDAEQQFLTKFNVFRTSKRHLSKAYSLENIRNLYKLCISWDIIFHFLLFLVEIRFYSNICSDYAKSQKTFSFEFDLWNCLRVEVSCGESPAEEYLSISNITSSNSCRKSDVLLCIRMWESHGGVNSKQICVYRLGCRVEQIQIFEIVIWIYMIGIVCSTL